MPSVFDFFRRMPGILGRKTSDRAGEMGDPKYFLCNGHGTMRHLATGASGITQSYNHDRCGNALKFNPANAVVLAIHVACPHYWSMCCVPWRNLSKSAENPIFLQGF